ncbi:hypothetical protein SSBR45G_37250 [Bradyrhizobium sp. SSBR45G]|uniref:hypothetical protein n=1 Tax=unclassified Bradyrhizobium TaxID=2631580 RepID=UPI002342A2A9|nr:MULTISPECIES: hypothetical protein [unclassified Bradyrhizobium]GLH78816.1 hypothetical protein SSBR45G_37250 [Bradyrhizobium sp. SSBR45G]GLH86470.1 hypothetical protein SSBR45R_39300 [Bradyrhizobium sp. SSBR45R]
MVSRHPPVFFTSDLHRYGIGNTSWFDDNSPRALAGRCLVDALEYLRASPKFAAKDWHVVNANAARIVHQCLADTAVARHDILDRVAPAIEEICARIVASRQFRIPFYGDDFWDWASVVDAFCEVQTVSATAAQVARRELDQFRRTVHIRMPSGLSIGDPEQEWFGPAIATRAHRLLDTRVSGFDPDLRHELQAQALERIERGRYRGRQVTPWQISWHYGQVVGEFQRAASEQAAELADFAWLAVPLEPAKRALVLARILQGAGAIRDRRTVLQTLEELYRCETPGRPLGQGVIGASIEASLDVLEALWAQLDDREKAGINAMLDALRFLHAKAHTIGFVVETPEDIEGLIQAMGPGTLVEQRNATRAIIRHSCFHAVICLGRSMTEVASATSVVIEEHGARWVMMPERGHALGPPLPQAGQGARFVGAGPGDLVISTALAPFRIDLRVRDALSIAEPPLPNQGSMIIPTDPELCHLAHQSATTLLGEIGVFFEGVTVTCDGSGAEADVAAAFPGALASDETAYVMALICLGRSVPCLVIQSLAETAPRSARSPDRNAACRLAVKVSEMLCRRW